MKFKKSRAMPRITDPKVRQRLEARHTRVPCPRPQVGGECWEWQGYCHVQNGYGQIKVAGRVEQVHRVSYAVYKGPLTAGETADHECHNPPCMNPAHLKAMSLAQNQHLKRGVRDALPENTQREPGPARSDGPPAEQ